MKMGSDGGDTAECRACSFYQSVIGIGVLRRGENSSSSIRGLYQQQYRAQDPVTRLSDDEQKAMTANAPARLTSTGRKLCGRISIGEIVAKMTPASASQGRIFIKNSCHCAVIL